jgi:DNA-binding transcriptional regulator PaaX
MGIQRRYRERVARRRQPTLTGLILEKISEAGEALLDGFFPAKYPEARLWRNIIGLDRSYEFKRSTFSSLLSQLRQQGLVERRVRSGRSYWRITPREQGAVVQQVRVSPLPADGRKRLVCFDIPERGRTKRRWLRGELLALGYQPFQKSVWIGETPLPREFLSDLDALALRGRVQVLLVMSEGTLAES